MKKKPQAGAKPGPAKKPAPWAPVPVAVQIQRHRAALKAAKTRAAHAAAAKKHPKPAAAKKPPVKRKLALGEAVACCAAEALAASLRLTGWRVTDEDVLALYEMTAGGPDEGASILATLEAAAEHGLGPGFPVWRVLADSPLLLADSDASDGASFGGLFPCRGQLSGSVPRPGDLSALILGLQLPDGPHAVCDDGTAWWSWGQPYDPADFPAAIIEEAWEITWPPR